MSAVRPTLIELRLAPDAELSDYLRSGMARLGYGGGIIARQAARTAPDKAARNAMALTKVLVVSQAPGGAFKCVGCRRPLHPH
jgi:hypothetical protein